VKEPNTMLSILGLPMVSEDEGDVILEKEINV